ncbi:hypothetical protein ABW19_dt0206806 [Dactylella cylindrospora]|nr:hypothetical protein ABW19_dt0206806 [Dactylella cylindrospora]
MASEYQSVRSRILSGGSSARRLSAASASSTPYPIIEPLTPICPEAEYSRPPIVPSPTLDSSMRNSVSVPSPLDGPYFHRTSSPAPAFTSLLANHVKGLSQSRISRGFLHLVPSVIHPDSYLPNTIEQYQQITDLLRRIDINIYNISPFKLESFLSDNFTRFIYGSNWISHCGTDLATTSRICQAIFSETGITELNLPNTSGYRSELSTITDQGRPAEFSTVLKGRDQVSQLAKALMYFIENFVFEGKDLTQELLKETHRILVKDHDPVDGKPWEEFGGWYRDYRAIDTDCQGNNMIGTITTEVIFECPSDIEEENMEDSASTVKAQTEQIPRRISIDPRAVSVYMSKLINSYHTKLEKERDEEGVLADPFTFAAWLCTEFLHVHPFIVMNGTMCRIIVSGMLFKELGIVTIVGEDKEEGRDEWISILERWKEKYGEDGPAAEALQEEAYSEFSAFLVRKATTSVEALAAVVGSS